jgi:hypothetical protein
MISIFDFDIKAAFRLKIQECSIAWIDALFPGHKSSLVAGDCSLQKFVYSFLSTISEWTCFLANF